MSPPTAPAPPADSPAPASILTWPPGDPEVLDPLPAVNVTPPPVPVPVAAPPVRLTAPPVLLPVPAAAPPLIATLPPLFPVLEPLAAPALIVRFAPAALVATADSTWMVRLALPPNCRSPPPFTIACVPMLIPTAPSSVSATSSDEPEAFCTLSADTELLAD